MKKSFFHAQKIVTLAFFCLSAAGLNAQITSKTSRYEKHEVYEYDTKGNTIKKDGEESRKEKEVSEFSEIELPLRRISYGEFRDDFDRLIADNIRKDAKKIYQEQESAKEVNLIEEIELPITKCYAEEEKLYASENQNYGISYYNDYSSYSEPKKVVFYDGLGRKISDSLAKDAKKLYEKQLRAQEWSSWRSINLTSFWYGFWGLIKTAIYIVLIVFGISFVWRKVKAEKEDSAKAQG